MKKISWIFKEARNNLNYIYLWLWDEEWEQLIKLWWEKIGNQEYRIDPNKLYNI